MILHRWHPTMKWITLKKKGSFTIIDGSNIWKGCHKLSSEEERIEIYCLVAMNLAEILQKMNHLDNSVFIAGIQCRSIYIDLLRRLLRKMGYKYVRLQCINEKEVVIDSAISAWIYNCDYENIVVVSGDGNKNLSPDSPSIYKAIEHKIEHKHTITVISNQNTISRNYKHLPITFKNIQFYQYKKYT